MNVWNNEYNPFQKFKVLCWYDRMQKIPSGKFDAPVNIALDIIQGTGAAKKCAGLKCDFCMSDLEDVGKEAVVPFELLMAIPKFYRDWGVLSVCLAGHHSDPLVYNHEKLGLFLREMYRNDVEVGLVTNGVLLTDFLIQDITRNAKWTGFSVNAGTAATHRAQTGSDSFDRIAQNIAAMTDYCLLYKIHHPVGYKFLITDRNQYEILEATKLARSLGCRHMQIRPCELPAERVNKIDIAAVQEQMRAALEIEEPGKFEVFGITEKFSAEFKKKQPQRCIASPLGSTWKADGDVVICPDRRWSAHRPNMTLGNFIRDGLEGIRRKWGGPEHVAMIKAANDNLGQCIRCTSYSWNDLYEKTMASDTMDVRLI